MVQMYTIFGRQVGSHYLSLATLGVTFAGSWLAVRGGKKPGQEPPINASSKEEEAFVQEFLKNIEAEEKKTKA